MAIASSNSLFYIFGLGVTSQVVTTWGIILVLVIFSLVVTHNIKEENPGRLQIVGEMAVGGLRNLTHDLIGPVKGDRYLPLLGTLFVFIAVSNYTSLLPLSGRVTGFAPPTTSLSVTAALAIVVFFSTHFFGFKAKGIKGYLKHFVSPVFFMLPLLLMEELVRPLSLSLRLYGNVYGEHAVIEQLGHIVPIGLPLVMEILALLFCLIQALVFTMLTAIYIDGSTGESH